MIKQLPQGKIYEITRCFPDQFMRPSLCRIVRSPDAAPKKGMVMSKWHAACVVLRLEKKPKEWKQLHVGGISCHPSPSIDDATLAETVEVAGRTGGHTCGTAAKKDPLCPWPAWTSRRPSTWQDQKYKLKVMGDQDVRGWVTAAFLRQAGSLEGQATLEHVEDTFDNTFPCFDLHPSGERLKLFGFGSKMAKHVLWTVEPEWKRRKLGRPHVGTCQGG